MANNQETRLFCGEPLLKQTHKDSVKDHCDITGMYRGAAQNSCNLKMRIKPKTDPIPVVSHNLRGYEAHHVMQAMSQLQKEVKCVANNMEKYITFSVGGLRFIDSLNVLQESLDSLVRAIPKESLKITGVINKKKHFKRQRTALQKGDLPLRVHGLIKEIRETRLPDKEKFYSKLNDENITDKEYAHAQRV